MVGGLGSAAMTVHGIRPGPMLLVEGRPVPFRVIAMLVLACIAITVVGLLLPRPLLLVMAVRLERLMPVVHVLCVIWTLPSGSGGSTSM